MNGQNECSPLAELKANFSKISYKSVGGTQVHWRSQICVLLWAVVNWGV